MSYIKKLQSKSEDTRKQVVLVSVIASMCLVVAVWMYSMGLLFTSKDVAVQADNSLKPFTLFANSIKDAYNNVSASVGSIGAKSETPATNNKKQIDLIQVEHTN